MAIFYWWVTGSISLVGGLLAAHAFRRSGKLWLLAFFGTVTAAMALFVTLWWRTWVGVLLAALYCFALWLVTVVRRRIWGDAWY